jgi:hypothetical protein
MVRDMRLYLHNSVDLIHGVPSAFMWINALLALIRMDKVRQTYKRENETDGECVKRRGELTRRTQVRWERLKGSDTWETKEYM